MYPRHFSELAEALERRLFSGRLPGRARLGLGAQGAQCARALSPSPMDSASTSPFSGTYPAAAVLVLGALFTPRTPSPAGRGVSRDWGVQLGLKADLGRKPHAPRCPLSS